MTLVLTLADLPNQATTPTVCVVSAGGTAVFTVTSGLGSNGSSEAMVGHPVSFDFHTSADALVKNFFGYRIVDTKVADFSATPQMLRSGQTPSTLTVRFKTSASSVPLLRGDKKRRRAFRIPPAEDVIALLRSGVLSEQSADHGSVAIARRRKQRRLRPVQVQQAQFPQPMLG